MQWSHSRWCIILCCRDCVLAASDYTAQHESHCAFLTCFTVVNILVFQTKEKVNKQKLKIEKADESLKSSSTRCAELQKQCSTLEAETKEKVRVFNWFNVFVIFINIYIEVYLKLFFIFVIICLQYYYFLNEIKNWMHSSFLLWHFLDCNFWEVRSWQDESADWSWDSVDSVQRCRQSKRCINHFSELLHFLI